ncbi:MAG: hypothetical protein J6T51_04855 [Kiritimatiellae bacterium]|nr:hypothetical protein [Kiritimatiellia bacterium]
MKKILMVVVLAAVTCFAAGKKKDAYDIKPDAAKPTDAPAAEKWQAQNRAKLADATKDEALAAFVKDKASASALLSEVKPGFQTCPVKAFQIAAVTQYVMLPGKAGRALWTEQLLAFAAKADAADVKMFYLDQLRWCGLKSQAGKVRGIARASKEKAVVEFAEQVATELSGEAMSRMLGE